MVIRGRGPQTTNALLSVLTEIEESTRHQVFTSHQKTVHINQHGTMMTSHYQDREWAMKENHEASIHSPGIVWKNASGVFLVFPHLATPINLRNYRISKYGVVLDYS
ncbi:unnamed protein product [Macrosiphum euphorbiae]|uniref:Uncharacterized protein n=1 Tax=Macrosiphum euphorbiae TaxID=13131 RepID=A0AAV0VMA0_9HEMI|nr:unnamed protein product [Macrosiphum euphorbiae]